MRHASVAISEYETIFENVKVQGPQISMLSSELIVSGIKDIINTIFTHLALPCIIMWMPT